jgi:tetratricopeptide (TPR) repeat protein
MTAPSVIDALMATLDAEPDDDAIRRHLADLLIADGRAEEALAHYEESLHRHPGDSELRNAAALAARLCGRLDEAQLHEGAVGGSSETHEAEHEDKSALDGAPRLTLADVGGLDRVKRDSTSRFWPRSRSGLELLLRQVAAWWTATRGRSTRTRISGAATLKHATAHAAGYWKVAPRVERPIPASRRSGSPPRLGFPKPRVPQSHKRASVPPYQSDHVVS